jgi:ketosteroid isomerase-like protein
MKRLTVLAAVLLLAPPPAAAQTPGGREPKLGKVERHVLALDRGWADAMVRGDVAALERLFDDDMIVTSGSGAVRGKAGELEDVRPTPDLKTYFFNTEDRRVRVYGDAAVLTGHARWRINFKGRDIDNERRYTSVYAKRGGRWRMVALQLTRLASPPPQQPR